MTPTADRAELDQAERDLRHRLDAEPADLLSLIALRNLLIPQRRYTEAVDAFREAIDQDDASQELLREYGETLRQTGRLSDARGALDEALWKNPQDAATRRTLGWVLLDMRQPKEAMTNFEVAAQNSSDPAVQYEALTARVLSGQYEDALQRLNQWQAAHPDDGEAWRLTGWLYWRAGAWPEALAAAQRAVQLAPYDAYSHDLLGNVSLHSQDDPSSALQEFTKAIGLAPDIPRLLRGYAQALWMAGRVVEAQAAWEQMLDMLTGFHEDAEVSALKGWCLGYLGRLDEAVIEYGKALAASRWEPSVTAFDLAITCLIGGDDEGAASALDSAWHFLDDEPSLRRRGIVAATLADLRAAERLMPRVRESQIVKKTEQCMEERLAKLPTISS